MDTNESRLLEFIFLHSSWKEMVEAGLLQKALDFLDVKLATLGARDVQGGTRIKSLVISLKGDTYYKLGLFEEAISQYQEALALFDNEIYLMALGKAYWKAGDAETSEAYFAKITDPTLREASQTWKQFLADWEGEE